MAFLFVSAIYAIVYGKVRQTAYVEVEIRQWESVDVAVPLRLPRRNDAFTSVQVTPAPVNSSTYPILLYLSDQNFSRRQPTLELRHFFPTTRRYRSHNCGARDLPELLPQLVNPFANLRDRELANISCWNYCDKYSLSPSSSVLRLVAKICLLVLSEIQLFIQSDCFSLVILTPKWFVD